MTQINDADFDGDIAKGGTWKNVTLASFEALQKVAEGNATSFVWGDEGRFKSTGSFEFNGDHKDFQPLLIDKVSAQMMLTLHGALEKPENKAKFETWVGKCRGHFGYLFELTQERVNITGFTSR
jgi:hypothetical protein